MVAIGSVVVFGRESILVGVAHRFNTFITILLLLLSFFKGGPTITKVAAKAIFVLHDHG